jgi:hypothetical protein
LLIPVLLFKKRKLAKTRFAKSQSRSQHGEVIEGVVIEVKDDGTR